MAGNNRFSVRTSAASPSQLAALTEARRAWTSADDPVARLYRRVTTTLALDRLLAIFGEELSRAIPVGQLVYRHRLGDETVDYSIDMGGAQGNGGAHRCEYQLTLEGINYGSLAITRRSRFSEEELEAIEFLLGIVICPLRNACHYALVEQSCVPVEQKTDCPA